MRIKSDNFCKWFSTAYGPIGCVQYTAASLIFIIVIIFWSPRDGVLRKKDGSGCSSQSYYLPLKSTWIFSGLSRQSPGYTKPDLCPHVLSLLDLTSVVHKQGSPSKAYGAFKNKSLSLTFRYRAVGLKVGMGPEASASPALHKAC